MLFANFDNNVAYNYSIIVGTPVFKPKVSLEIGYSHLLNSFNHGADDAIGEFSIKRTDNFQKIIL